LHFPKPWCDASGSPQVSQGVARCAFRFWLRACFFSCSVIGASIPKIGNRPAIDVAQQLRKEPM
jgi:hypothetical protein